MPGLWPKHTFGNGMWVCLRHEKAGCVEEGKQEWEKEQNFIVVNIELLVLDQYIDQYSVLGTTKLTLQADILFHKSLNIPMCIQVVFPWPEHKPLAPHPVQCGWLCEGCSGTEHTAVNNQ